MAWTTPPTFTDGNVLSATQLNTLSSNCEYLYGVATGPNIPFSSLTVEGTSLDHDPANNVWYFRHQFDYFHFRIEFGTQDIDSGDTIQIYYNYPTNTTEIFDSDDDWVNATDTVDVGNGTGISSTDTAVYGYVDISGLSLTVGEWYPVHVYAPLSGGGTDYVTVAYLIESNSTSLLPT